MNLFSTTVSARALLLLLVIGLIGPLTGCFQAPPASQYTLTTELPLPPPSNQDAPLTILVGPVKLASYLDQPRIVKRFGANRIETVASRQWAGNLREMISNKLVAELGTLCHPSPVFPFPAATIPHQGKRVTVDILRFEGTDDQHVAIEARWTLLNMENKSILKTQVSLFQIPCADPSYETLATTLSLGLTRLIQEISQSIIQGDNK
ncbi:MAG: hypothetical protein FD168_1742 [Desulfobulbaceae bacterium]|nr:MAG: hypothetical protein FD168_1742 [Desulfobulbaceae bacterium]